MSRSGLTLSEASVIAFVAVVLALIVVPAIAKARRADNERRASGSLATLGTASVTFKTTDADANGVNDYWTADVAGFYSLVPSGKG